MHNLIQKKSILSFLLAITICLSFVSCGGVIPFSPASTTAPPVNPDEQMIIDRLDAFAFAYSSGDIDAVVECFDAQTRNGLSGMLSIGAALLGVDIESWLVNLFGFAVATQDANLEIMISSITFIDAKTATVDAVMGYSLNSYDGTNTNESSQTQFNMVKENGDWYIEMDMSLTNMY